MIANLLPQLLTRKGVSIRQLSRATGITYSTIWALVHSQRRSVQLEVLDAVCAALDIQPGDIYRRPAQGPELQAVLEVPPAPRPKRQSRQRAFRPADEKARRDWRSW
jgi:putative transcriptional regulator